jgi:PPP family 3-phenylpropionic acid transporter
VNATAGGVEPYWRLSAFYGVYFALVGIWMSFWPLYLKELGLGAAAIGAVIAIQHATKILAPSLWGWLADRSGQRMPVIRAGALGALLVFLLLFWRSDPLALTLIMVGYTFFWNAVLAQFEVVTLAHLGSRHQRYSLVRVWGSIGFIAVVAGLGYLFDLVSLQWLPSMMVALLVALLVVSLSVREAPPVVREGGQREPLARLLAKPAVIAFFAVCLLLQLAHGPYYTFFSIFLEQHGYSRTETGLLWSLGVVAEVLMFLVMYRLLQRFGVRAILLASLALAVVRWLLIGCFVDNLPLLLFAQLLHAATFASYHACAVDTVRRLFAGGHEGQGMALYSGLSYGAGGALGAVTSGLLWSFSPLLTFALASLASLLALGIAWYWLRD